MDFCMVSGRERLEPLLSSTEEPERVEGAGLQLRSVGVQRS